MNPSYFPPNRFDYTKHQATGKSQQFQANDYHPAANNFDKRVSLARTSKISQTPSNKQFISETDAFKKSVAHNIVEYFNKTNLHGLRQVVEKIDPMNNEKLRSKFQFIKDIIWSVLVLVSIFFGIVLLVIVYNRYETTPTITTIETNNFGIWNVPFPAVTICNVNTVSKAHAVNVTKFLTAQNVSADKIQRFYESLNGLILFGEQSKENVEVLNILGKAGYDKIETIMQAVSQSCENLLKLCKWLGKVVDCTTIFRRTRSDLGYCCSFNYKALKSLIELGVSVVSASSLEQLTSPVLHVSGAGEDMGLTIAIDADLENYLAPKKNTFGVEILVHDSENYPEKTFVAGIAQPGTELTIGVDANVVVTDDSIRSYPVELRFCRYDDEKLLKITKKYSYQSCITDCRIRTILQKCDCLPYYYPFIDYLGNGKIGRECTLNDTKCLAENRNIFASLKPPKNVMNNTGKIDGMTCDCLPNCMEQTYYFESFSATRTINDKTTKILNFRDSKNYSIVKIHFKDLSVIKYRRTIFMTWDNLLAAFGGVFGLLMGGSVLSLFELIYYLTYKWFTKYLSYRDRYLNSLVAFNDNDNDNDNDLDYMMNFYNSEMMQKHRTSKRPTIISYK